MELEFSVYTLSRHLQQCTVSNDSNLRYDGMYLLIPLFTTKVDAEGVKTGLCKHCPSLMKKGKDIVLSLLQWLLQIIWSYITYGAQQNAALPLLKNK